MCRTLLLLAGLLMGVAPAPLPKQQRPDAASQSDLQAMQGVFDLLRFAQHPQVVRQGPLQLDELAFAAGDLAQSR